jgi:fructose PTS system EIIBC or EIIC component
MIKLNQKIHKHIMSGISPIIPLLVVASIFMFIFLKLDSLNIQNSLLNEMINVVNQATQWMYILVLPVFAGFIAYSIANKPGIVPGLVGGGLAVYATGMIGALVAGFIAGYLTKYILVLFKNIPNTLKGLSTMVIIPLLSTLLVVFFMLLFNMSFSQIFRDIEQILIQLDLIYAILFGLIFGIMMAIDMGGPINKIAFFIGIVSISQGRSTMIMASIMASGMVPPLSIALLTLINKRKFKYEQNQLAKKNWMMGLSFMTEGAIPFAAENPKKVMPAIIIGSALAGALIPLFGTTLSAPHGGILVLFLMTNWWGFLISLAAGTMITVILLLILLPNAQEEVVENK